MLSKFKGGLHSMRNKAMGTEKSQEDPQFVEILRAFEKTEAELKALHALFKNLHTAQQKYYASVRAFHSGLHETANGICANGSLQQPLQGLVSAQEGVVTAEETRADDLRNAIITPIAGTFEEDVKQIRINVDAYKLAKKDYDFRTTQYKKSQTQDAGKQAAAQSKLEEAKRKYDALKEAISDAVVTLEAKKESDLVVHLNNFASYQGQTSLHMSNAPKLTLAAGVSSMPPPAPSNASAAAMMPMSSNVPADLQQAPYQPPPPASY